MKQEIRHRTCLVKSRRARGFTLIELLIVIAILAILSVVVVLTLNPAELLRQARDSSRISDLATIKKALQLYLADSATSSLASATYTSRVYVSNTSTTATGTASAAILNRIHGGGGTVPVATSATPTKIDGSGWVGATSTAGPNLNDIGSGAPLSVWPMDVLFNNNTYFYSYAADTTAKTFEINAKMESIKYSRGGSADVESTDGGNSSTTYEVGSAPGLAL